MGRLVALNADDLAPEEEEEEERERGGLMDETVFLASEGLPMSGRVVCVIEV